MSSINSPQCAPSLPPTHHLMRVRVRVRTFSRLKEIAQAETQRTGEHTSVSDLVRDALSGWIRTYDATENLRQLERLHDKRPILSR